MSVDSILDGAMVLQLIIVALDLLFCGSVSISDFLTSEQMAVEMESIWIYTTGLSKRMITFANEDAAREISRYSDSQRT
jgi:hypothetical protein